jgi:HD-GYP domain-containing protein (c-di-GMP phosphodiesterase class II)
MRHGTEILTSVCDAAAMLARRLGLGREVQECVGQQFERWDGKGPLGKAKDAVPLPVRVGEVATQAVLFLDADGPEAVLAMVKRRAGSWFDPDVVRTFCAAGASLMAELAASDPWQAVLEAEPAPVAHIDGSDLDLVARCFADMVDLKSPYTVGHSSEVAALAEAAARRLGLPQDDVVTLRRAALLHDLGRVGVSSGIWDKVGPLTRSEWEQVRLHPYHTERILSCSSTLAPLGWIAGLHHERLDGSGYHHGVSAPVLPVSARILAAADTFQTATQDRPYRPARTAEQAAEQLTAEATAGRLDPDCVAAVIEAAGQHRPRVRRDWPAGLSEREVEVLRLLARGLSNAQIAERLVISRRTAEHHVQHIYTKIGHSTRAAATLFAMEHDLLRS